MSTRSTSPPHTPPPASTALRRWGFIGLAVAWWGVTTFVPLGLPNSVVVLVLGLLVTLSVEPDSWYPERGVVASRRNLALAVLAAAPFGAVAVGMDLLLGRVPIESGHIVLATCAAVCVLLPRLAETRDLPHPAALGHRELIISVTALVAVVRGYQVAELFLLMVVFAVLGPIVMAVRRVRLDGGVSPRRLAHGRWALQAGNFWLFLGLLGAAGLTGTFFVWGIYLPDARGAVVAAFWVGLVAAAVLVAFPRPHFSVMANVLVALGSVFLAVQLIRIPTPPPDAVTIGVPFSEEWQVVNGGRSTLVNAHWTLDVERNAIDLVQVVDGKTYRGDRSRLENFHIFGDPLLAVADGRVTAAVDGHPDLPIGGTTWHEMAGNHVILDIGGGRYVLYGHLRQGSVRVRVGDDLRRGQVLGQVGDSGNSDTPHLHLQVQNRPTFDIEDRTLRTYPMVLDATVPDPRRGDPVRAFTEG